jgi:hypothetical protein
MIAISTSPIVTEMLTMNEHLNDIRFFMKGIFIIFLLYLLCSK